MHDSIIQFAAHVFDSIIQFALRSAIRLSNVHSSNMRTCLTRVTSTLSFKQVLVVVVVVVVVVAVAAHTQSALFNATLLSPRPGASRNTHLCGVHASHYPVCWFFVCVCVCV